MKLADYDTRTTSCADLIEDRIATTYPGLRVIEDTFCDSNVRCLPVSRRSTCDRRYLDRTMWDLGQSYVVLSFKNHLYILIQYCLCIVISLILTYTR